MKVLKFFIVFLSIFSFANAEDKILFLAVGDNSFLASGTLNGARESAKNLAQKYGKKIGVQFVSIKSDENIAEILAKHYVDGFKGAVIFSESDISDSALNKKIDELSARGFLTASAQANIVGAKLFCSVKTDQSAAREILDKQIAALFPQGNLPLMCVFSKDFMSSVLTRDSISKFDKNHKVIKTIETTYYSLFAEENEIEIMRMDNYGLIVFNPQVLADMTPVKKDLDRRLFVCVGGAPYILFYFKTGVLDACIMDDNFGFGYCALRAMGEKLFIDKVPTSPELVVAPLLFTSKQSQKFRELWKQWGKQQ